jgi:DNA-binding transcriptional ArsR family regulator
MSEQQRDDSGQFSEKVSDNGVLKAFDRVADPVMTASELADELPMTREATTRRLGRMREAGLVDRKKTGARSVAWWAERAPRISEESAARVERSRQEIERGEFVALEDA